MYNLVLTLPDIILLPLWPTSGGGEYDGPIGLMAQQQVGHNLCFTVMINLHCLQVNKEKVSTSLYQKSLHHHKIREKCIC